MSLNKEFKEDLVTHQEVHIKRNQGQKFIIKREKAIIIS